MSLTTWENALPKGLSRLKPLKNHLGNPCKTERRVLQSSFDLRNHCFIGYNVREMVRLVLGRATGCIQRHWCGNFQFGSYHLVFIPSRRCIYELGKAVREGIRDKGKEEEHLAERERIQNQMNSLHEKGASDKALIQAVETACSSSKDR